MKTKLTLRLDDELVGLAKAEAKRRGKSVSQMVGEYIASLSAAASESDDPPPVTASLIGLIEGVEDPEASYKNHLGEKYG